MAKGYNNCRVIHIKSLPVNRKQISDYKGSPMNETCEALSSTVLTLCENWADAVERYWFEIDDNTGCYGPGYIHWGVQSNFNYIGLMSTLAAIEGCRNRELRLKRAKAALRFNMASHITGNRTGLAGRKWGRTWISMLGIERAMHGIARLIRHLADEDQDALKSMLVSEADWILTNPERGGLKGVFGGMWAHEGANVPESNVWWAALLWRTAQMYPDEPHASDWMERSHDYFVNGVSRPRDAESGKAAAGKTVRERYQGPNFFPNFALDHHGYLNIGYVFICMSNAAMLHFDMKKAGFGRPETLDHNQEELWNTVKNLVFADGRLARIGGDSRIRYAYCQEYLLPSLLYAADRFGDLSALGLAAEQIGLAEREARDGDGLFYGRRLETMRNENPHYYTRLESDRACTLSHFLNYSPLVDWNITEPPRDEGTWKWQEPEHGAVAVRSRERFASFSWRAYSVTQALCLPPDKGDMAEWYMNLTPDIRSIGDYAPDRRKSRNVIDRSFELIDNGFVTCGSVMEGIDVTIDEGGNITDQFITHIAFAALPDGRTCAGLQFAVSSQERSVFTRSVKTLHLNIPNDVYNGYSRRIHTGNGIIDLSSPAEKDGIVDTESLYLNVDGVLGVVAIYGGESLKIDRSVTPRGGRYENIRVEEICLNIESNAKRWAFGDIIADIGFAVIAGADPDQTASFRCEQLSFEVPRVRGVKVTGMDGNDYALIANFSDDPAEVKACDRKLKLDPNQAKVIRLGISKNSENGMLE